MTTSLTSGLPRRETCTKRPRCTGVALLFWLNTRTFGREAVDHTWMIGWSTLSVTSRIGTWIEVVCTFTPAKVSTPS